jgi:hypothetical protein
MLYIGLIKRLFNVSISLTSDIRADDGVRYDGVAQVQTKVPRVGSKVRAWMMVLGVRGKCSLSFYSR